MKIFGLSGYAQTGKDTVGSFMVKNHDYTRTAFADRMKEIALAIDPIVDWRMDSPVDGSPVRLSEVVDAVGWERAKQGQEIRALLQHIGTEAGRRLIGDDVWVTTTFNLIDSSTVDRWVITDVRFPNEAEAIVNRGGVVIRIERPGVVAPNDHFSEHALKNWEFNSVLHNDGSLAELEDKVELLLVQSLAVMS